jgi:hypothetical protein
MFPEWTTSSPCEHRNLEPDVWEYCGYPRDYNQHRWCAQHYVGRRENGRLIKCKCRCHVTGIIPKLL